MSSCACLERRKKYPSSSTLALADSQVHFFNCPFHQTAEMNWSLSLVSEYDSTGLKCIMNAIVKSATSR